MSWIQKLYETYERASATDDSHGEKPWPLAHIVKRAHIEVIIDANGNFRRCKPLDRGESPTLIQVSEFSAGRTRDVEPHPLCDELGYCAPDLPGREEAKHQKYIEQLDEWNRSSWKHKKAVAVRAYLAKGTLWTDINNQSVLPVSIEDSQGRKTKIDDEKVFIRWRIEEHHVAPTGTWEDESLMNAWFEFDRSRNSDLGLCMLTGEEERIGKKHPRFIRSPSDGAKLISSNDDDGYTYRGRFTDSKKDYGKQTCTVGFDASQKAHSALRWLIKKQGYRNGDQVIVSWATSTKPIPRWFDNTLELFGIDTGESSKQEESVNSDTAQGFGIRLRNAIRGYSNAIHPTEDIVVLAMDSATGNQGRMAITFYRELKGSDFLERIEHWHKHCAWPQNFGKDKQFIGAPAPRDIVEAAYGPRPDEKLSKAAVERLLPCIVDGLPPPSDLVDSTTRRASNPLSFNGNGKWDKWEWKKCLGIACALFRGHHFDRSYAMDLEQDRTTRDYLYGRLLAIADNIEGYALYLSDEGKKRETTAIRFMQRFAARPFSTWATIELSLVPYLTRLKAGSDKSAAFLFKRRQLLDEVMTKLDKLDERTSDSPLSGEFLLGYHCQRQNFRIDTKSASTDDINTQNVTE